MGWTTLSFPYGSVLTSAKMTQLYDNITAQANGDSGAPDQKFDSLTKTATITGFSFTGNSTQVLPVGIYQFGSKSNAANGTMNLNINLQIHDGNGWVTVVTAATFSGAALGTNYFQQQIISDGTNARITGTGASGSGTTTISTTQVY